ETALREETLVGSGGDDPSLVQHDDPVHAKQRGPTVRREQDRGPVLEAEERLQDLLLGAGVDASEGVVEEKHGALERQRARQGDALLLPTRERDPALADHGIEPRDRKSTRLNSSHVAISYAVFCLK